MIKKHSKKERLNKYVVLNSSYSLPLTDDSGSTKADILMKATIMFAKSGYASVSVRNLADAIGIKPASLYNHFSSKDEIWEAVLAHGKDLYLLYFDNLLNKINLAGSFHEVLDIIFEEPLKMDNTFTCYAFCLVQAEQFRDERAAEILNNIFLGYSINFFKEVFDNCISKNFVKPFDTKIIATIIMQSVLIAICASVHIIMGRKIPVDPVETLENLKAYILTAVQAM